MILVVIGLVMFKPQTLLKITYQFISAYKRLKSLYVFIVLLLIIAEQDSSNFDGFTILIYYLLLPQPSFCMGWIIWPVKFKKAVYTGST